MLQEFIRRCDKKVKILEKEAAQHNKFLESEIPPHLKSEFELLQNEYALMKKEIPASKFFFFKFFF